MQEANYKDKILCWTRRGNCIGRGAPRRPKVVPLTPLCRKMLSHVIRCPSTRVSLLFLPGSTQQMRASAAQTFHAVRGTIWQSRLAPEGDAWLAGASRCPLHVPVAPQALHPPYSTKPGIRVSRSRANDKSGGPFAKMGVIHSAKAPLPI